MHTKVTEGSPTGGYCPRHGLSYRRRSVSFLAGGVLDLYAKATIFAISALASPTQRGAGS
jgi:hypothetical protein